MSRINSRIASQDVHESALASAGLAHDHGQLPGIARAVDSVEDRLTACEIRSTITRGICST